MLNRFKVVARTGTHTDTQTQKKQYKNITIKHNYKYLTSFRGVPIKIYL